MSNGEVAREVVYAVLAEYHTGATVSEMQDTVIATARSHGVKFNLLDPKWSRWKRALWEFVYGGAA